MIGSYIKEYYFFCSIDDKCLDLGNVVKKNA